MIWLSGFLLGLIGSLHCAAMCGPIAVALSGNKSNRSQFLIRQLIYNLGRTITYIILGGVIGLIGKGIFLSGFQQSLSILAGILLFSFYFIPRVFNTIRFSNSIFFRFSNFIKNHMSKYLKSSTLRGRFITGMVNGLLPCGLVYVAAAGAIATGSPFDGMLYMLLFGLGTFPMLLTIAFYSKTFQSKIKLRVSKLIPVMVVCISMLFILRGMNLGIKYVSPQISKSNINTEITDCE